MDEKAVTQKSGIKGFLNSADPLSEEAIQFVLNHAEEDLLVDYKESFDYKNEKCWIDIAIDAAAFSNTYGGYIVFGIQDKTYRKIGISESECAALCNIKELNEKLSRNIRPNFRKLRSKAFRIENLQFVIIYIPRSLDRTHIFEEDMNARFPSGQTKCLARKGAIYVRKTASNQIVTSDDFEELLGRRVKRVREKILEGVSKAIKAEPEHEILVVAPDKTSDHEKTFKVVDAPDAIAIKGLNLVTAPSTPEGKIALWHAAHKINHKDLPHREALMEIYIAREELKLMPEQVEWLAQVSLLRVVPSFYWLSRCDKNIAKNIIRTSFGIANRIEKYGILKVARFYGRTFYEALQKSKQGEHVRDVRCPVYLQGVYGTSKLNGDESKQKLEILARKLSSGTAEQELAEARKIDCGLYAPFDE